MADGGVGAQVWKVLWALGFVLAASAVLLWVRQVGAAAPLLAAGVGALLIVLAEVLRDRALRTGSRRRLLP